MGYLKLRVAASAGVLLAGVWGTSMALYTDAETTPTTTFTTGTLDLGASPVSGVLTMSNMAPGDAATAPLEVSNLGSLDLRYAMTATASGPLAALLTGTVKSGVTDCSASGFDTSGAVVATGALGALAFGDPAAGEHAGDRILTSGVDEVLCFQVALPLSVTSGQGDTGTASFTFAAEQTKNN